MEVWPTLLEEIPEWACDTIGGGGVGSAAKGPHTRDTLDRNAALTPARCGAIDAGLTPGAL
jgi:hypothetical protein